MIFLYKGTGLSNKEMSRVKIPLLEIIASVY